MRNTYAQDDGADVDDVDDLIGKATADPLELDTSGWTDETDKGDPVPAPAAKKAAKKSPAKKAAAKKATTKPRRR